MGERGERPSRRKFEFIGVTGFLRRGSMEFFHGECPHLSISENLPGALKFVESHKKANFTKTLPATATSGL